MSVRIKQQGGIYTVIRSVYEKQAGRGVETTIGSFKADSLVIPDEIRAKLIDGEEGELLAKFSNLITKKIVQMNFDRLNTAEDTIRGIASALRNFARFSSAEEAEKVYAAIADLKLSMREAGYKQTRAKQEPAPIPASKDATKAAGAAAGLGAKNGSKKS